MQIVPAGNLPTYGKKYNANAKLVIINLQPTKQDKKADLLIHDYVDNVMRLLFDILGMRIPEYSKSNDPVVKCKQQQGSEAAIDWTQSKDNAKEMKKKVDKVDDDFKERKRRERAMKKESELKRENGHSDLKNTEAENIETKRVKLEEELLVKVKDEKNLIHDQDLLDQTKEEV